MEEELKKFELVTVNGEGNEVFKIIDINSNSCFLLNESGQGHGWESKRKCHLYKEKLVIDDDITFYKIDKYDTIQIDVGYSSRHIDKNETLRLIKFLQKQLEK